MSEQHLYKSMRESFIADRLKDVPEAYQNLLSDDYTSWNEEAKRIIERANADAARLLASNVPSKKTEPKAQTLDFTKMTGDELIAAGIERVAEPVGPSTSPMTPDDYKKSADQLISEGMQRVASGER